MPIQYIDSYSVNAFLFLVGLYLVLSICWLYRFFVVLGLWSLLNWRPHLGLTQLDFVENRAMIGKI